MKRFASVFMCCLLLPAIAMAQVQLNIDSVDVTAYPTVRMKVRVTDGNSNVGGLGLQNFAALEMGINMPLTAVYCEDTLSRASVAVLLLIDISGSMRSSLDDAKRAATSFVNRLQPGDSAALVAFDDNPSYVQPWTADMDLLKSRINSLFIGIFGGTALWDAVVAASNIIRYRTQRRIIIVLSDGADRDSQNGPGTAISYAISADATVYTIGLGRLVDEDELIRLADMTEGKYFYAPNSTDLDQIYSEIAEQLQTTGVCELQYISPIDCWNGDEVHVDVEVNAPGGLAFASTSYNLPYDTTTFSYVQTSILRDYVVEAGEQITIPVQLTRVSPERAPSIFEFSVDYDTDLLHLVDATVGDLTTGYTIQRNETLRGSDVRIIGGNDVTTPGELCYLTFEAAPIFESRKTEIGISPPEVQQFCTIASSQNGLVTVSGTCERALGQSEGTVQREGILNTHPNPITGNGSVTFGIATDRHVILRLVDAMGNEVRRLIDASMQKGEYFARIDSDHLPSGRYFLVLSTGSTQEVVSLIVAR
ncbi:VWA domain-containing protein [bacterium]|nr:VWA domain-containing protein [bacterium]